MEVRLFRQLYYGSCFGLYRTFGSLNLTTVRLRGVGESFRKHTDYESKGIKAHFNMDESGVLGLDRVSAGSCPGAPGSCCWAAPSHLSPWCVSLQVESVFETVVEDKPEEESTLTSETFGLRVALRLWSQ